MVIRATIVAAVIIALMLAISAMVWVHISPDKTFPTHWGVNGKPDAYNNRDTLFALPAFAAILTVIVIALPFLSRDKLGIERSAKAYYAVIIGFLCMMLIVNTALVLVALGVNVDMISVMLFSVGLLFVVLGNYMGKTRRNSYFGIRTPWAYASELSWAKTQRCGGRLFVILGLLLIILAFIDIDSEVSLAIIVVGSIAISVYTIVYSYLTWRQDPNKQPPRFWSH